MSERVDGRAERGEHTRAAIVASARELFTERGYADVGTNEVVEHAGVTRGAMYHHFPGKRDLFRAVYEQTEQELVERTTARVATVEDPWELLVEGMRSFFDICMDPRLRQIGLIDGPAVLGWEEWREIGKSYVFGLVVGSLHNAMEAGVLRPANTEQLAHLIVAALGEAAMLLASADDLEAARPEIEGTVMVLLEGLRA